MQGSSAVRAASEKANVIAKHSVLVAMSGGVDSAVAAALLKQAGHEVVGVHMRLCTQSEERPPTLSSTTGCCSLEAADDARSVSQTLGIPFYVLNFESEFRRFVIDYFTNEYLSGRTPNPCLACNRFVKFEVLLRRALALGLTHVATGHYARIVERDGRFHLLRAVYRQKDQSYVLYALTQEHLARLLFPLGWLDKASVRRIAAAQGLVVADKDESQEICFIPDNDYRRFLREAASGRIERGPIVDTSGTIVGEHAGLAFYTVGQRRGIGIAARTPLYVVTLDTGSNTVVVGEEHDLWQREFTVNEVSFVSGQFPVGPMVCSAKIRYRGPEAPAVVEPLADGKMRVVMDRPQRAIAPGQAAVFYDGEEVLGGGIIERARLEEPSLA